MSKIIPLISFGFGLIVIGMCWSLMDGLREYFDAFIIDGPHYQLQFFIFRMMPMTVLFVGIMCLIGAGVLARKSTYTEEN